MSIINEALKKTEQRLQENAAKNQPQGDGLASASQSHQPQGDGLASASQSHQPQGDGLASASQSQNSLADKKIARGDNFRRFSQWYGNLFSILILLLGISLSSFIFSLLGRKLGSSKVKALARSARISPDKSIRSAISGGESIKIAQAPKPQAAIALQQPVVLPPLSEKTSLAKEEQKAPETTFVLNGIFFSDNDGYALINNQIVRENDLVDGAKVKKITANSVELNSQEKLITLSTRR